MPLVTCQSHLTYEGPLIDVLFIDPCGMTKAVVERFDKLSGHARQAQQPPVEATCEGAIITTTLSFRGTRNLFMPDVIIVRDSD